MLNNILEISKRSNKNGRVPIKIALLKIHDDAEETNKNGLHWKREYVENAMESAIGMPFCAEFADEEKEVPLGHGLTGQIINSDGLPEPIFENSEVVGTCNEVSIETIKDADGNDIEVLVGSGYLYSQRYPKFVKWVRKNYALGEVCTSIEIMGTPENDNKIVFEEDEPTEDMRTPMRYVYTGCAILSVDPADDDAIVIEVAEKKTKKEETTEMEFNMDELKNSIKEVISEMNDKSQAYETTISELNEKIEAKDSEISEKDNTISELNASVEKIQAALDKLENDQKTWWEERELLTKELAKAKVAEKLGEVDDALAEYNEEEKEVAKDDIDKLKENINSCEKVEELNEVINEINSIKSKICMNIVATQKKAEAEAKVAEQNAKKEEEKPDVEDIFSEICMETPKDEKEEDINIF